MWKRLRRFSALEKRAQGVFLRAAVLLPVVRLSLRVRGFGATQAMLRAWISGGEKAFGCEQDSAELTARMVKAAGRHGVVRASCLEESLALWFLLARQGISTDLRIGIRREGDFAAHAWIERNGVALNEADTPHRQYAAFETPIPLQPSGTK